MHGCREIEGKTREIMFEMSNPDSVTKDLSGGADSNGASVDADEDLDFDPTLGDEDDDEFGPEFKE